MALREYQENVALNRLYEVRVKGGIYGSEMISPSMFVDGGSVNLYSFDGDTQPATLADMQLSLGDIDISGKRRFSTLSVYFALTENQAGVSNVVFTGVDAKDLGAIS